MKKGFSSKVRVDQNKNLLRKAHDRYFSTFTKYSTTIRENDFATVKSGHFWDVGSQRTDYDVGAVALDRKKVEVIEPSSVCIIRYCPGPLFTGSFFGCVF